MADAPGGPPAGPPVGAPAGAPAAPPAGAPAILQAGAPAGPGGNPPGDPQVPPAPPAHVALSDAQFQMLLSRTGTKDDAVEERVISKFKPGSASGAPLVKAWHGSHVLVPDDIVALFKAGLNLPLSLLTVAAIHDYRVSGRRSQFHPKMGGKLADEFSSWHLRDEFLPFTEWSQATNTLMSLWRHFRPVDPDEDPKEDPVQQFTEHFLLIAARVTSQNWAIWREYDKRVRKIVWSERSREHGLPISLTKVNTQILADAELSVTGKLGAANDFGDIDDSDWWAIITSVGPEVMKVGKKISEATARFLSSLRDPDTSTKSSAGSSKRRREDDHAATPAPAPSARAAAAAPPISINISGIQPFRDPNRPPRPPLKPTFCVICRQITADHAWQGCSRPANASLNKVGHGWVWPGKAVALCAKFNAGNEEVGSVCLWGHYCAQCGQQGHRAIEHGVIPSAQPQPLGFAAFASGSGTTAATASGSGSA